MRIHMKSKTILSASLVILLAATSSQATVFFSDTFGSGSTLGSLTPAAPTANSTSYQLSSSKSWSPTPTIASGDLQYGIAATSGGGVELQALFTDNPVSLVLPGDYLQLTVTFTNTAGLQTANCLVGFGLYDGGQVAPIAGGLNNTCLNSVSDNVTGGVQGWTGYWGQKGFTGENSRIVKREPQKGADNRNQNLTSTGSGSQSYGSPAGATVGSQSSAPSGPLVVGNTYTVVLRIDLIAPNTLAITNTYYDGPTTGGAVVSQFGAEASGANYLTSTFDALGIGWRARSTSSGNTLVDISSITVDGSVTVVTTPPDIVTQPVPVTVPSGSTCAYQVVAQGFGMTYQWQRYGTNLVDGGNISGATSDTLVISPVSAADVASGANGYFVTVNGVGGYSTNSVTSSLTLGTAKNLVWSGSGNVWDLNTSANWLDGGNPVVFNYGDAVTFNDIGVGNLAVTLTGNFLSASSVTVDTSPGYDYTFANTSTGNFAGPGYLLYKGAGFLTMNNVNTYTGGTIISNASAYLILGNYNALGTGPVTLAKAGGLMEVVPAGGATSGINGDVIVADDFNIQFDGSGAYAGVVFGNLSGTVGKTLTLSQRTAGTTNRYRVYGANTTFDANLQLDGAASPYAVDATLLAPYQSSGGLQIYNGVISGNGGVIQRGGGTTVLSGQNTYTGGTIPTTGTIGFGANSTPTSGTVSSGPIGTGALMIAPELPNTSGSGTVLAWGDSRIIANPLQYPSATNNQTLIIGGTNDLTFSGPYTLNGNDGLGAQTTRTLQVANTGLTTISGVISDGGAGIGLTKTGAGVLKLTATETYTGATIVSAGTLLVSGQLGSGNVSVAAGATLAGSGTIAGPVSVAAGGILAPGNSIGTLTINNSLSLSGNLSIDVNRSGFASDKTVVSGTLANAGTGTVTITNLGAALQPGDTFALFNKPVENGSAMTITGGQVVWNNNLAADGTISVASTIATTPTNITYSVSGNSLTLSWPANYLTWTLQSNIVGVASSSSWFPVPNSGNVTQFVITVDPARSNVFYRLVAP